MEELGSRKNEIIRHLRRLAAEGDYRRERGEYLCDGAKLLEEALQSGAEIGTVLWKGAAPRREIPGARQFCAREELFDYASPMKNSPGPLFTVKLPAPSVPEGVGRVLLLEGVQDPGNVGTVIRTANAFGLDLLLLTGDCADLYHPKTVRATMGAIFRQRVLSLPLDEALGLLRGLGLPLYGAALTERARDLRTLPLTHAAVAVGSEGRGLSERLLEHCDGQIVIPMRPESESLNAAVAAAVILWEMVRGEQRGGA